ncbi:uncharacterized protein [Typha angustifolia]|uniref:uncharacterized protein n=1 Tax=Typha angustifolia TaxID=59011 RepID=UPI003C2D143E
MLKIITTRDGRGLARLASHSNVAHFQRMFQVIDRKISSAGIGPLGVISGIYHGMYSKMVAGHNSLKMAEDQVCNPASVSQHSTEVGPLRLFKSIQSSIIGLDPMKLIRSSFSSILQRKEVLHSVMAIGTGQHT